MDDRPNLKKNKDPLVEQEATEERQYYKDRRPVESDYKKADETTQKADKQVAIAKDSLVGLPQNEYYGALMDLAELAVQRSS
mgnify:CR=1 FL=1